MAAQYDAETQRLDIARALAGNTRAFLQIGSADDISRLMLIRHSALDGIDGSEDAGVGIRNGSHPAAIPDPHVELPVNDIEAAPAAHTVKPSM